jgi:hypothetical protein
LGKPGVHFVKKARRGGAPAAFPPIPTYLWGGGGSVYESQLRAEANIGRYTIFYSSYIFLLIFYLNFFL